MKYSVEEKGTKVIVRGIEDFNLKETFECGQCFRWNEEEDGSYTGVAYDRVINVKLEGDVLIIDNTDLNDFYDIWFDYFDLGRDYKQIKENLSKDPILKEAIQYGQGIRILRQDTWETLISFIISQNNRIPQIKKVIENLASSFGNPIEYKGRVYYTFPKAEELVMFDVETIAQTKCGFRAKYILDAASKVFSGEIDLLKLFEYSTNEIRDILMSINGVGPKVADCVILYSIGRYDTFPTDVWIKRIVEYLYLKREGTPLEIQLFAIDKFGDLSGFAQQYLFYYGREMGKKIFNERKK
ncbi:MULTISPECIES: DNA-3-methyladenine glycosylase family protein [Thermoanaerobacter]|uniref:DNA-(apurinic or apyrimidinic site) lyase n=3 Tax=Thermoanaerobacter TaxID=1754 RepID=I8QZI4_9THEO|nr:MULTISPECIES: DNA glycosylase [Thermoanaerobacter]EGD52822.1 8-oxoguanine DNA glycosylase domain-containing protein [Thermoanaerobacter ethanolicus JW 200]AEM78103.1 8-oxoguanine DNA glycosylase domain-containing protein [Thermoanaerobacter wiegelii Rt8.B1]EIW00548.1 3-methyladenine DNA glycosylase/8-oxoguanine DNA glycosylase [Thermoanaerobacter siderophilus SR4]EMT39063.1 3-methyladenine DNA glycosylase/8-oxoguanine DNA glycosylase [Thermoanaerobacter thermohydrosulfuricus WC1]UZQ83566.1 